MEILSIPAIVLVALTSLLLLISREWRWILSTLVIQYVGVFVLVADSWSVEMAGVKLVAGWVSVTALGLAMSGTPEAWRVEERYWPSGRLFRTLAAMPVWLVVSSLAPRLASWIPGVNAVSAWGSFILVGMGLLHVSLTAQPLRMIAGLLTLLSGFEILYAAVETSTLVAGLLGMVNLGIALTGAYLLNASIQENEE